MLVEDETLALAYPVRILFGQRRFVLAALMVAIELSLVANMAFATVSPA